MPTNFHTAHDANTADANLSAGDFRLLDSVIEGTVTAPGDAGWDEARQAWNLAVDQQPAAVAQPSTAADVQAIVSFARERGLRVAPQGTGHNAHPLEGRLARSILLKTDSMRSVTIDPVARRARVEAGALWMDVTVPAAEHGLAALAGSSPDVGVVGYTLGGGLSWLSRRHGLAANNVAAIELVTAEGEHVRATHDDHPDLFWALRGGGGSFGVVTAIEIELFPITHVFAGAMFWPQERAGEVLQAWREWTEWPLPDEIMSVARILNVPPLPEIPEPLRGRKFVVIEAIYLGEEEDGIDLIRPLRALCPAMDTFAMIPVQELSHLHMDPEHPVAGKGDGMLIDAPSAEMIDALVDASTGENASALLSAELRHLGGAIARPAAQHGATSSIAAAYAMFVVGAAPVPELLPVIQQQVTNVKEALVPFDHGSMYLNFAERPTDPRELYRHEYTYRRLRAIKTAYDPDDVIQSNHPIPPAR
ncbi:MAG: FAD-binding oxidoreductase [Solirubrobacterales bacterium]|nr:FAD-binding oxidoreductase [Solirubrobacterales bacterium]